MVSLVKCEVYKTEETIYITLQNTRFCCAEIVYSSPRSGLLATFWFLVAFKSLAASLIVIRKQYVANSSHLSVISELHRNVPIVC